MVPFPFGLSFIKVFPSFQEVKGHSGKGETLVQGMTRKDQVARLCFSINTPEKTQGKCNQS